MEKNSAQDYQVDVDKLVAVLRLTQTGRELLSVVDNHDLTIEIQTVESARQASATGKYDIKKRYDPDARMVIVPVDSQEVDEPEPVSQRPHQIFLNLCYSLSVARCWHDDVFCVDAFDAAKHVGGSLPPSGFLVLSEMLHRSNNDVIIAKIISEIGGLPIFFDEKGVLVDWFCDKILPPRGGFGDDAQDEEHLDMDRYADQRIKQIFSEAEGDPKLSHMLLMVEFLLYRMADIVSAVDRAADGPSLKWLDLRKVRIVDNDATLPDLMRQWKLDATDNQGVSITPIVTPEFLKLFLQQIHIHSALTRSLDALRPGVATTKIRLASEL